MVVIMMENILSLDMHDYLKQSNEERLVIYQVETPEVMKDIEAIAEMEGVDALFFGPGDYSLSLGVPGQMDHPDVVAARKKVADLARKNNKIAATPGGPGVAKKYIDMGYNLIKYWCRCCCSYLIMQKN